MPPARTARVPPAAQPGPGTPHGTDTFATTLAGEHVVLHAQRALHWPRERTLFVADVHLGKAAAFRAGGVPVPRGATAGDLARLSALVVRTEATRLVVLGDFLHAAAGRVAAIAGTRLFPLPPP